MMEHTLLAKIDALDAALGNSADLTAEQARSLRQSVACIRHVVFAQIEVAHLKVAPVCAVDRLHGRPPEHDMSEAARQAAMQGDAARGGFLPVRRAQAQA